MSNIYVQEPPTEGKVCLDTSVGDIDIELWSRECPKACRNFVQLCLEGYYDKTKFHRVVPEFIVQGGDPTGTGQGGESIWGRPFKDEFHSRLRFVRRGLVAMANAGKDDNGSQFFFTLGPTKELQNKHTIFGKVVGDTIFNMVRLSEGYLEDGDRPKYPHKILSTRVLVNPFPDIEPRQSIQQEVTKLKKEKPKSKMKATKDYKLLSFGEEAEDDEEDLTKAADKSGKRKSKSAHDLTDDPQLSSITPNQKEPAADESDSSDVSGDETYSKEEHDAKKRAEEVETIRNKLKRKTDDKRDASEKLSKVGKSQFDDDFDDDPYIKEKLKRRDEIKKELKALTKELKGGKDKDKKKEETEEEVDEVPEEDQKNDMLRKYHEEQKKYKSKATLPSKKSSKREQQTLALLEKFKSKLSNLGETEGEEKKEEVDDDDDISGDNWMKNTLKFETNDPVLAKDASTKDDDWFDIYDPRNPLNKRRREKDQKDGGKSWRDSKLMPI